MTTERRPRRKSSGANVITMPAIGASTRPALRDEEVARRAYEIFLARGSAHGHDVADWLQAERELSERHAGRRAGSR